MLSADPPNIDGALETARRTIRDGNRASEVISRLRALFSSKSRSAERVDLNAAAREVIALSRGELQRKRIELTFVPRADLPTVTGDRVQLQQVILNLLLNAVEALSSIEDRPRRLTIRTETAEVDQVRLTVEDTGVGITPDVANKLFEAFYTTKDTGMGIGLSVSRSIIEHHRGRIWASPNETFGTSVSFIVPVTGSSVASDEHAVEGDV
jgi:signal transduction histidine kinase